LKLHNFAKYENSRMKQGIQFHLNSEKEQLYWQSIFCAFLLSKRVIKTISSHQNPHSTAVMSPIDIHQVLSVYVYVTRLAPKLTESVLQMYWFISTWQRWVVAWSSTQRELLWSVTGARLEGVWVNESVETSAAVWLVDGEFTPAAVHLVTPVTPVIIATHHTWPHLPMLWHCQHTHTQTCRLPRRKIKYCSRGSSK